jgi:ABC-type transport system substrate-binding protein
MAPMADSPPAKPAFAARLGALALAVSLGAAVAAQPAPKTLRLAVDTDGDGFDPATYQSTFSALVVSNIFDSPYRFAYLRHGFVPVPNTAAGPPRVSHDGLEWTIEIRRGIYFADDPAFAGRPRELTAADYVYSLKRLADPRSISLGYQQVAGRIRGLDELRAEAERTRRFDYDRAIDGLQALDRYRLRIRLTQPMPNLRNLLAVCQVACAVATASATIRWAPAPSCWRAGCAAAASCSSAARAFATSATTSRPSPATRTARRSRPGCRAAGCRCSTASSCC